MEYTSGNYEAFTRPRKPAGVDGKTAWFVGSGLASLFDLPGPELLWRGVAKRLGNNEIGELLTQYGVIGK
ncbi:hypothetical protein ACFV4K_05765 [Nocardia sp. NPDC059764]|uniref:hypothetical protein n=1 Tax=Nocardia sp. NPDC059764 TaxID=3346939 RepID=UPI003669AA8B